MKITLKSILQNWISCIVTAIRNSDCENNNNASDNDDDEDADNDEGYDSEVSLANPYLGANFGFKIMYVHDYSPKLNSNLRSRYNHDQTTKFKQTERVINVPTHKPTFSDFKPLSDQLSESKRNYYFYPDYKRWMMRWTNWWRK